MRAYCMLLASSAEKRDDQASGTGGLAVRSLFAPTTTGHRGKAMTTLGGSRTGRYARYGTSKEADTR
jgi:hypothetical protein